MLRRSLTGKALYGLERCFYECLNFGVCEFASWPM